MIIITDLVIRIITEKCSRLKSLKADNCLKTTDESFIVLIYKLYLSQIKPKLGNLCIMGHFGIGNPEINYIKVLNQPCDNYLLVDDELEEGDDD